MRSGENLNKDQLLEKAFQMLTQGLDIEDIEKEIRNSTTNQELINELITLLKKEIHQKHLKQGRLYVLSGCVVMGTGFILTCFKFHASESVNLVMYGFTTLGICILFVGLYKIFN